MNQYKCKDCDMIFDEPDTEQGYLSEAWGHSIHENYDKCPYCGSYELDYDENGFEEDEE